MASAHAMQPRTWAGSHGVRASATPPPPRVPPRSRLALVAEDDGDGDGGGDDDAEGGRANLPAPRARWLVAAALVPAAGAIGTVGVQPVYRLVQLWALAAPIFAQYAHHFAWAALGHASEDERTQRRRELHAAMAPRVLAIINRLQGGYVKVGQVCSNRHDLLPYAYVEAFSTLQDQVEPRPWPAVRRDVERSLGAPLAEHFSEVEAEPIGSASIAQVHRGVLRATGQTVVLKVQRPRAKVLFMQDLWNIQQVIRIALPPMAPVVGEIRRRFRTEFDFAREARDMAEIGEAMRARFPRRVRVPLPELSLCTTEVLVMEWLPGVKLTEDLQGRLTRALGVENVARLRAKRLFGREPDTPLALRQRARLVVGAPRARLIRRRAARQLQLLLRAHGHQILCCGCFNGDPHGGNVLVCGRKLGLIDFGQVKRLTSEQRVKLATLVIALADDDEDGIVRAFGEIGFRSARMSREAALRLARLMYDRDDASGRRPSDLLREISQQDEIKSFPLEYVMAARVSLLLRGLGMAVGAPARTAVLWRPFAQQCLDEAARADASQGPGARPALVAAA